jgi:hypothetical protein
VAHRAIFAVTFAAAGLWLAACSGGPGPAQDLGNGSGTELPPASEEQAPGNSDQAPGNSDQPPVNPDQPPGNPDQPPGAGGGTQPPGSGTPCEQLCAKYSECPGPGINQIVRQVCSDDCASTDADPTCAPAVTAAIGCVSQLSGLCTEAGPGDGSCLTLINDALGCVDP